MIVLVRHGQTAANAQGRLQGRTDLSLSDVGRAQAQGVARHLVQQYSRLPAFDPAGIGARRIRIVTSPLPRAVQTAAAIASGFGVDVAIEPRLIELDYGEWEGRPLGEVSSDDWARWRNDPEFAPPGGESLVAVRARVDAWLGDVTQTSEPAAEVLIAVSHVSPIKAAICAALGSDDTASWRLHLDVASISRLERRGSGFVVCSFNETPAAADGVAH